MLELHYKMHADLQYHILFSYIESIQGHSCHAIMKEENLLVILETLKHWYLGTDSLHDRKTQWLKGL